MMAPKPRQIEVDGKTYTVQAAGDGCWTVDSDAGIERVWVAGPPGSPVAFYDGRLYEFETQTNSRHRSRGQGDAHALSAPMPATVRTVLVRVGDEVAEGETLVVLEAMKME